MTEVTSNQCRRHFPESGKLIASPSSCPWCQIELLRSALENISTVKPLDHFPAVTALAYCREKAIEALSAKPAYGHETSVPWPSDDQVADAENARIAEKATAQVYCPKCDSTPCKRIAENGTP